MQLHWFHGNKRALFTQQLSHTRAKKAPC